MSELSMLADEQMRAESDALYHAGMGDELSLSDREKCDEVVRLRHENTELRELVRDMWFWGYCGHMDSESQEWQMKHIDGVLDRMRKLGIEADK